MRAACLRRYFGQDWKNPDLYHIMIGSQMGACAIAELIVRTVETESTRMCEGETMLAHAECHRPKTDWRTEVVFVAITIGPWIALAWLLWPRKS